MVKFSLEKMKEILKAKNYTYHTIADKTKIAKQNLSPYFNIFIIFLSKFFKVSVILFNICFNIEKPPLQKITRIKKIYNYISQYFL